MTHSIKLPNILSFLELGKRENRRVAFVVGGGSSISHTLIPYINLIDYTKVDIFCVNNSFKLFEEKNVSHLHFADAIWYEWNYLTIPEEYIKNRKISTCDIGVRDWKNLGIHQFIKGDNIGLSDHPNTLNGSNSGHQMLNLVLGHLKYEKVYLFGFDCNSSNKQTHYHQEHRNSTNTYINQYDNVMIPGFESLKDRKEIFLIDSKEISKENKSRLTFFNKLYSPYEVFNNNESQEK